MCRLIFIQDVIVGLPISINEIMLWMDMSIVELYTVVESLVNKI